MVRVRFTTTRAVKDGTGIVYQAGQEYDLPRPSAERWARRNVAVILSEQREASLPALALSPGTDRIISAVVTVLRRPDTRRKGASVGWSGYGPEHVIRLRDQVALRAPDLRFVCLTDMEVPNVETIPLLHDWPGWWSKIELFRAGLVDAPAMYIDLDSVVLQDPRKLVQTSPLTVMADPYSYGICSAVMAIDGDLSGIYDTFAAEPEALMKRYRSKPKIGDQGFIEDATVQLGIPNSRFDTPAVASFKEHCKNGLPPEAVIVTFHGTPKPDDVSEPWVAEALKVKPAPRLRPRREFVTPPAVPPTLALPPEAGKLRGEFIAWLAKKFGWTHGVELGVWQGKTLVHLLKSVPDLHMTGVDLWAPQPGNPGPEGYQDWDHAEHETRVRKAVERYSDRVTLVKDWTAAAAAQVLDGTLDFVWIDADHSEQGCRGDIEAWAPKLKETGWLIGHDISWPGVRAAVEDLVPGYAIGPDVVWFRPLNPEEGWESLLLQ